MTLQEFSRDVVPILALGLATPGVVGLLLVARQLKLAKKQIELANMWNRAQTQHGLLNNLPNEDHEKRFWAVYDKYRIDQEVDENAAARLYDEMDDWICVKMFMNKHEAMCAAIESGYVDDDYAYTLHSAKVIDLYNKFRGYIAFTRRRQSDDDIYIELEKVAIRWTERYNDTEEKRKSTLNNLKSRWGATRRPEFNE